ncbi:MAG TPA: D-alanyl-D-alanine carboxypeptidase/D-alanyl-D-alanine-endopeptidase [Solirubrobacterales bacterium]|nr:D-alanyl-D-alanine carboxypeptidase/D-alanyl-D-alanine-endopeptidase [Solirubrobacterales bacterium]
MTTRTRSLAAAVLVAVIGLATASSEAAGVPAPKAFSEAGLKAKLGGLVAQAAPGTGVYVFDPQIGDGRVLFADGSDERRILASNTKLFTTSTALDRLGPDTRLVTRVWADGPVTAGTLDGSLYLVGDGDPTFGRSEVEALAQQVKNAGIAHVTGKVLVDDTIFDRRRGLGKNPNTPNPYVGPLSGLSYEFGLAGHGFSDKPEIDAGTAFREELEDHGIGVGGEIDYGKASASLQASEPIASVSSEPIGELVEQTNEPSNNFFAEMLLKRLAAEPGEPGTTRSGAQIVRAYARRLGTRVRVKDGSGIGRKDQTSAEHVGELLVAMLDEPTEEPFYESLPRAGIEGTLSNRMEGTAAEGRCRAKTGTINAVSALSGYCELADGPVAFSILMNGVGNVTAARGLQDRMVVAIAQYQR